MIGKTIKLALVVLTILAATLMSSWFGAVLWVKSFPSIIEYRETPTIRDNAGHPIDTAVPGQWVVFTAPARRQPLRCWGEFVYVLHGDQTNYQFPMLRSYGLTTTVAENYLVKNLFQIPEGIPLGDYAWDVVIYQYCDGVQLSPITMRFDRHTRIIAP
jgi:hypothetical protein